VIRAATRPMQTSPPITTPPTVPGLIAGLLMITAVAEVVSLLLLLLSGAEEEEVDVGIWVLGGSDRDDSVPVTRRARLTLNRSPTYENVVTFTIHRR